MRFCILTLSLVSFPTINDDKNPPNEDSVLAIPNIVPETYTHTDK